MVPRSAPISTARPRWSVDLRPLGGRGVILDPGGNLFGRPVRGVGTSAAWLIQSVLRTWERAVVVALGKLLVVRVRAAPSVTGVGPAPGLATARRPWLRQMVLPG